jgi:hypothetical protein
MVRKYEFRSSCPAPVILSVCQASRNLAINQQDYVKLFGTVWFDFDRDTLFLDFGESFPSENTFTGDDLSMADLKRVRFLAGWACPFARDPLEELLRLVARMDNLERMDLCGCSSIQNPRHPTDYSDVVFTSRCPGFFCCYLSSINAHFQVCSQVALHILDCNCSNGYDAFDKRDWYTRRGSEFGIALPQPGPQIRWMFVQSPTFKATMIENAEWIGLEIRP